MKLLREFMFGKYKQYLADQQRLQHLEKIEAQARTLLDQHDNLLSDLSRFHQALLGLQKSDVSHDYREAMGDATAVFLAVIGEHLRAKS